MAKTFYSRLLYDFFVPHSFRAHRPDSLSSRCVQERMYVLLEKKNWERERERGGREKQTTFDVELQMRRNEKRYLPRKRTNSLLKIGSGRNAHNYTMAIAKTAQIHQYKSFASLTQPVCHQFLPHSRAISPMHAQAKTANSGPSAQLCRVYCVRAMTICCAVCLEQWSCMRNSAVESLDIDASTRRFSACEVESSAERRRLRSAAPIISATRKSIRSSARTRDKVIG